MPHIHTEPGQYDFTASAYIILQEPDQQPRIWLHRHVIIGKWLQFGGHVELDETPWQAVMHEIPEESGYAPSQLKILQPQLRIKSATDVVMHPQPVYVMSCKFPIEIPHTHTDIGYVFITSELPLQAVGDGESGVMKAMTISEVRALSPEDIPTNVQEAVLFIMENILSKWEQVDCHEYQV